MGFVKICFDISCNRMIMLPFVLFRLIGGFGRGRRAAFICCGRGSL